jgi:hypothetical protein
MESEDQQGMSHHDDNSHLPANKALVVKRVIPFANEIHYLQELMLSDTNVIIVFVLLKADDTGAGCRRTVNSPFILCR